MTWTTSWEKQESILTKIDVKFACKLCGFIKLFVVEIWMGKWIYEPLWKFNVDFWGGRGVVIPWTKQGRTLLIIYVSAKLFFSLFPGLPSYHIPYVTLSAKSSLILGGNKAAFRREGHIWHTPIWKRPFKANCFDDCSLGGDTLL